MSNWDFVQQSSEVVYIRDNNTGKSITNDVEKVCEEIVKLYGNKKIMYKDTQGMWDELCHDNGKFLYFKFIESKYEIE